MQAMEL